MAIGPRLSLAGLNPSSHAETVSQDSSAKMIPGELLVRFRKGAGFINKNSSTSIAVRDSQGEIPISVNRFAGADLVPGLVMARVAPEEMNRAISALNAREDVLYAEPNYVWHRTSTIPNDPRYSDQWGVRTIEAAKAWDISTCNSSVVVGVLDGGVDISHEDLRDNIWTNPNEIPDNGIDDDSNGFVDDLHGWDFHHNDATLFDNEVGDDHATHVAGIIGARGNNSIGVAGVCWGASLMPIKVLGPNGGSVSNIIAGYSYAKKMRESGVNLRVLNNSYGGPRRSQAAEDAIAELNQAEILFVVAAGNQRRDNFKFPHYPANYDIPNVIAVAATHEALGVDPFYSNYGARKVALAAPGSGILSTTPNNTYSYSSGTSMAAPHVAGAAALVIATKPGITTLALKNALIYSTALPSHEAKGRLDVYKAVLAASENDITPPAAPPNLHFQPHFSGRNFEIDWTAPGDDGNLGTVSLYELTFITASGKRIPMGNIKEPRPAGTHENLINLSMPFRNPSGTLELRAVDNVGNGSAATVAVSMTVDDGMDPYIVSLSPNAPLSTGGQRLALDGDDQYFIYQLPFDVGPGGNFPRATVSTNGVLHFGLNPPQRIDGTKDDIPGSVEYLTGLPMIAGLWEDLVIDQARRADAGVFVVQPNADSVIFRWQATTFGSGNAVNFEIELRRDRTYVCRYGDVNETLSPVVGLSFGEPEAYVVPSHTLEYWQGGPRLSLDHAPTVTFAPRPPPPPAVFQLNSDDYQVSETSAALNVTVTRPISSSGFPTLGSYSVSYTTSGDTALPGIDYVETSGTLTFNIGEGSKSFSIPIINDTVVDPGERFNLRLSNPTNSSALGAPNNAIITISDDDSAASTQIQFSATSYIKPESGPSTNITVTRTGDTSGASSVDFRTEGNGYMACNVFNGLAVQNCDFILNQGTLNFAAGQTSRTFPIIINDDTYVESNEMLGLTLFNPVGANLGSPSTATLTITDNDTGGAPSPVRKTFIAALTSGQAVPTSNTSGKGGGIVQLDTAETGAKVGLMFSDLSSAQTDAHIHGPMGGGANGPIVFPLPSGTVIDHSISPTAQQVVDLKFGLHYMNVHTSNFTAGEIRGQLLWNPLNEPVYLVTQHYYDFLGRLPDQGGQDFWVNSLTACGINVQCLRDQTVGVSNAFFYEQEYQQTASYVFLLYRAAFGNTQPFPNPDPNTAEANKLPRYLTFVRDRAQVVGGTELANSQSALANAFVQRPEFIAKYPLSLSTGAQFVDAVLVTIQSASGVTFAPGDRTALINHFDTGGRGRVMFHLANDYWNGCNRLPGSQAAPCVPAGFGAAVDNRVFIDAEYNRSFVYSQYSGYLRRDGDIGGFLFWLNQVSTAPPRNVAKQKAMVCSFLTSAEYQQRFSSVITHSNAECAP